MANTKLTSYDIDNSLSHRKVHLSKNIDVDDKNSPFSYIEWLKYVGKPSGSPETLQEEYKKYILQWDAAKNVIKTTKKPFKDIYVDYLKQITFNHLFSSDEKRFVNTLDYNNPYEVDAATAIFTKRIKQLCHYIFEQREDLKHQVTKVQQYCTTAGISKVIYNEVLRLLKKDNTRIKFTGEDTELETIKNELRVEITELYDLEEGYYDNNVLDRDFSEVDKADNFNSITFDPNIFLDTDKAIEGIIANYAVETNLEVQEDFLLDVTFKPTADLIEDLPPNEFIDYDVDINNLTIDATKQLISQSIGTDLHYLRSNSSTGNIETGVLVKSTDTISNIFNRHNPSVNYMPNTETKTVSVQNIGGFFTPSKLGVLNYTSIEPTSHIVQDKLEDDTLYVYSEAEKFGTGSAVTTSSGSKSPPFDYNEPVRWVKSSKAGDDAEGDIIESDQAQKFYNYQSDSEKNLFSKFGISRFDDPFDFWSGDSSDIWANTDIYELESAKDLPLEERQEDLLVNQGQVFKWRSDIYGNEYALIKQTEAYEEETGVIDECDKEKYSESLVCNICDAKHIKHRLHGYQSYEKCVDGGSNVEVLDVSASSTPPTPEGTDWVVTNDEPANGFSSHPSYTDFINSGYFLPWECTDDEELEAIASLPACRIMDGYSIEPPRGYQESDYYELSGTYYGVDEVPEFWDSVNDIDMQPYTLSWDDIWDAGEFNTVCSPVDLEKFYNVQETTKHLQEAHKYGTTDQSLEEASIESTSIAEQLNGQPGELIVRNITSNYTEKFSKILEKFLRSVPEAVELLSFNEDLDTEELRTYYPRQAFRDNLIDFDIISDIIILKTERFMFVNKITYNYESNSIDLDYTSGFLLKSDYLSTPLQHFYNEKTGIILIGNLRKTDGGSINEPTRRFYPDNLYKIDVTTPTIQPSRIDLDPLHSNFHIDNNIKTVTPEPGIITYNEQLDRYYITTIGTLTYTDYKTKFFVYQVVFSLNAVDSRRHKLLDYSFTTTGNTSESQREELGGIGADVPDEVDGLLEYTLDDYLLDDFRKGSSPTDTKKWEDWLHDTSSDPSIYGTPLLVPGSVDSFYLKLKIDPNLLLQDNPSKIYKVSCHFARPDFLAERGAMTKCIDTKIINRPPLVDYSRLDMTRMSGDDLGDPRQEIVTYEYNFQKSPAGDGSNIVSHYGVRNNNGTPSYKDIKGQLYKILIVIRTMDGTDYYYPYEYILSPFNIGTCLTDLKLISATSFMDRDYDECTLLVLESKYPSYIAPVMLKSHKQESITFNKESLYLTGTPKANNRPMSVDTGTFLGQETVTNLASYS